jgi:hypothetical protein
MRGRLERRAYESRLSAQGRADRRDAVRVADRSSLGEGPAERKAEHEMALSIERELRDRGVRTISHDEIFIERSKGFPFASRPRDVTFP